MPITVPHAIAPTDPLVAAWKLFGHRLKRQAPKPTTMPVGHEISDVRPEGASVTEIVVAVDKSVPELAVLDVRYRLQRQRLQIRERHRNLRLRIGGGTPDRPVGILHGADLLLPLRRQLKDAGLSHARH